MDVYIKIGVHRVVDHFGAFWPFWYTIGTPYLPLRLTPITWPWMGSKPLQSSKNGASVLSLWYKPLRGKTGLVASTPWLKFGEIGVRRLCAYWLSHHVIQINRGPAGYELQRLTPGEAKETHPLVNLNAPDVTTAIWCWLNSALGLAPFSSMGDITVDPKGVTKLLDGLNVHKASGPDGLNARVLTECSNEISPILALIYNESLARGEVPDEWRQANVSPVFKKGEKYDAANYRPVSLTCICCKTLEHILVSNINKHIALDSILADCQHGFRSQRSCETQLVQFVHDIISNLDGAVNRGHKQTDLIIMDFAKAFDKVPHRRLLHKLEYYGIRGSTHKWINSWLSGRTQQVVLDGQASDPVPVLSGVPQGSVLGPVLFLLFINDLPDNIRSSVRLFADDCVLYRNIHSLQDCLTLQEDLTSLGQWEADWQMKFNVAKCHSMRVTRHQHHKQILFDYSLHNQTLENVQSAKYLGITITDNMDWGQHVSEISSKATKTLGFLRRNLAFAPRSTKEVAYKTLVRPKLEYAAPIWSPHLKLQINQIEKVQRTAARWTCRRWRNTSSVGEMLDELDWPSLEARRDQSSLLLFHKIHCGAVSIEKDKYMTPAHSLKTTRSSHSAQYRRHQTYSDALKNSFFPRTIPHWNSLSPSVANAQSTEEFRALLI